MKLAVYPGSFDPVTLGHLDIIVRASKIFDKLIVGVPINPDKHASFSVEERMELLRRATQAEGLANVEIDKVDGLSADYAKRRGAMVVVKGLRALSDFEYEFQQALTNKKLNPELETMFLATSAENMFLSSSMVKQVAGFGGDISPFVPRACILETIRERLCRRCDSFFQAARTPPVKGCNFCKSRWQPFSGKDWRREERNGFNHEQQSGYH